MTGNFDKIARWGEINHKLEAAWDPVKHLVAEREEIEKVVPWLKGKGATPFPPKPPTNTTNAPGEKGGQRGETMLIDEPKSKRQKSNSEKGLKTKIEQLKSQGVPGSSISETPVSADNSQSFQGNNT